MNNIIYIRIIRKCNHFFFIFILFIIAYVLLPWNFDVLRYFALALPRFTFLFTRIHRS